MERVRLSSWQPLGWAAPAVAMGNFDGVHRGHQALIRAVAEHARAAGGTAVALTFDPHPARVLSPERAPAALLTLEQKSRLLEAHGIERLVVLPFTHELAALPPEEFARQVLSATLGARSLVVGSGFRFGRGRSGDAATLEGLGGTLGFRVHALPPVLMDGAPISSTRIREALREGAVEAAGAMLGRPVFVEGPVVPGDGRGRTLGIPTANVEPLNELLPAAGVYAGFCSESEADARWPAVLNLGRRPTFGGEGLRLEAHLLGFDGDLYGRTLRLEFQARLRDERRFDDVHALLRQIRTDIDQARRLLSVRRAWYETR